MGSKQTKANEPNNESMGCKVENDMRIQNIESSSPSTSTTSSPSKKMTRHTSVVIHNKEHLIDLTPDEDVSMFLAPHPEHIPLHVFSDNNNNRDSLGEEMEFVDFCVKLMPHQHTLFCERRERVCEAVGKIQEGEELEVDGLLDTAGGYWIRSQPRDKRSVYSYIEGTENSSRYTLTAEDDGCYVAFQYAELAQDSRNGSLISGSPPLTTSNGDLIEIKRTINSLGPVLPGPPRMLDLRVEGKHFQVGECVRAEGQYIGGKEGLSEYWWFKIMKGKRIQLSEPLSVLNNEPGNVDPRVYMLQEEDVGCVLKVKCRPIRSDGHEGEIFTSKPSAVVVSKLELDVNDSNILIT